MDAWQVNSNVLVGQESGTTCLRHLIQDLWWAAKKISTGFKTSQISTE
jgi:hypothetical protein